MQIQNRITRKSTQFTVPVTIPFLTHAPQASLQLSSIQLGFVSHSPREAQKVHAASSSYKFLQSEDDFTELFQAPESYAQANFA